MPYQNIEATNLKEVFLIEPKKFSDERGWYCPQLEVSELEAVIGMKLRIIQEAESYNFEKGVLRGLHYQKPDTQGKLVRVISGKVLDVAIDVRYQSSFFGQHAAVELSANNSRQLWVPPGFAHGYLTLEENTRFSYLVTEGRYNNLAEKGVNPFDATLNISWPISRSEICVKPRDLSWPSLKDIPIEDLLPLS